MRKQDELLNLIKTLNTSEKRYFKVYSKLVQGNKNYLKLFDLLVKQEYYDATALSKQLGISTKNLAYDKQYLQDVLLRALRIYDQQSDDENALLSQTLDVRTLLQRRQHQLALKICNRALEKARQQESHAIVDHLLNSKAVAVRELNQFVQTAELAQERLANARDLYQVYELLSLSAQFANTQNHTNNYAELKSMSKLPIFNTPVEQINGFKAKMYWYTVHHCYYNHVEPNADLALKYALDAIAHCEAHPDMVKSQWRFYLNQHITVAIGYFYKHQYEQGLNMAIKLDKLTAQKHPPAVSSDIMVFRYTALVLRVTFLCALYRYTEAEKLAADILQNQPGLAHYFKANTLLYYAVALFHNGKTNQAYNIAEEVITQHKDTQVSTQCFARLLQLMIHVNDNNLQLVQPLGKTTKMWVQRNNYNTPLVSHILNLLNAVARGAEPAKITALYNKVLKANEGHIENAEAALGLGYWLRKRKFLV